MTTDNPPQDRERDNGRDRPNERPRGEPAQGLEWQLRLRQESQQAQRQFALTKISIKETWERLLQNIDGAARDRNLRRAALNLLEDTNLARRGEKEEAAGRERAEAAERASHARFRTLFESIDEAFCIIEVLLDEEGARGVDYRFVEVNPAFERHTGLADAAGRTMRELAPMHDDSWVQVYAHIALTGESARFENRDEALGRDYDVYAFRTGEPRERRVAVLFRDITQRKAADDALRESQERLRLVVENAREYAIISMDLGRGITGWNAGARRILGYSENEALGQSADLIFTPEDRANDVPAQEAAKALTAGRASDERWHLHKDGTRFWGSGVMTAMHDATGAAIGLLKIFRDNTEQRQARQTLEQSLAETQQARADAEAAGRAKDHFLAVLSHELRTPLTPVFMVARTLLRRKDLPPDIREGLEMIERNIKTESRMIEELLDLTRIQRGKMQLQRKRMDVREALDHALTVAAPDIDARKQELIVKLAPESAMIDGDSMRLEQALWNVLKNASKFTPEQGQIRVSSRLESGHVLISISDTGIGIHVDALANIFDPFTQADDSIAREFGGLGLGLALARAIIDGHGGTIFASSDGAGRGTAFHIRLPLWSGNTLHDAKPQS